MPRQLLIIGEPGIGKSRLLEACLLRAAQSARILRARPAAAEADLSFAALADLVGDSYDLHADRLPQPQRHALAVALLRAEADGPADSRTIGTATASLIAALASEGPVVIAIDDAQWLDPASASALAFAARRLPAGVRMILARRADTMLMVDLESAITADHTTTLRPGPLSVAALHHLVVAQLGARPSRPVLLRIASASGGNPFYAIELARSWRDSAPPSGTGMLPVSIRLSELVDRRIARLGAGAVAVFGVVALAGRPKRGLVDRVVGRDVSPEVTAAVDEGLLVAEDGRLRFSHPIFGTVVTSSLVDDERRALHGRLADLVDDEEEGARHLSSSLVEPDEDAARRIEAAARTALGRGATAASTELYAAAVRLTPEARTLDLARRLVGEAGARLAIGDVSGARIVAERAEGLPGDPDGVSARLALADVAWADGRLAAARDGLAQALATAPVAARGKIAAQLVGIDVVLAPARVASIADIALELLPAATEPALRGYVLINRFFAGVVAGGRPDIRSLEDGLHLESVAMAHKAISAAPLIWYNAIDDAEAARGRHAAEDAWYRDRGQDGWRAERLSHLALTELRAGNWQLAETHVESSCATIEAFEAAGAWPTPFAWRSLIDAHRGRTERARRTLLPLIEAADLGQNVQWAGLLWSVLGFVEFADGDLAAADRALGTMRERFDLIGYAEVLGDRSEPLHVEALLELGENERARDLLARLERRATVLPRPWIALTLPRTRALVLAAERDLDGARAAIADVDLDLAQRLPFEAAWNALTEGRILRRLGHKRAAAEALTAALSTFTRLGAPAWEARTRSELDRVGLRRADPLVLTASEHRIALLAASGMTNREIAQTAFISPKTVEANLARVYGKLGIRSRAELGARMASEGSV